VPWTVQQSRSHLLRLGTLWQQHGCGFLVLDVGIEVEDLDCHVKVVEEGHDLDLVGFLVEGLDLGLAEELDR
jgi:hypothetical protein